MNAIGYIRISPRNANYDGVSLDVQTKSIRDYCTYKGIDLLAIYGDKFISGKNLKDRPGANTMLMLAQEKKIDAIIVYKLDRFMRNTIETLDCCALLEEWGIKFISLHEEVNTSTATGRFFLTVLAALGQMEREQISERTKAALALKMERGEVAGRVPYGFSRNGKYLSPNLKDYECYLRLKELKEEKVPHTMWEDIIYSEGYRNRTGGKRKYSDLWRLRRKFDSKPIEEIWADKNVFARLEEVEEFERCQTLPCM